MAPTGHLSPRPRSSQGHRSLPGSDPSAEPPRGSTRHPSGWARRGAAASPRRLGMDGKGVAFWESLGWEYGYSNLVEVIWL